MASSSSKKHQQRSNAAGIKDSWRDFNNADAIKTRYATQSMDQDHPLLTCDHAEAGCFLQAIDPDATRFTFQTFDDSKLKRRALAQTIEGTLDESWERLVALNNEGAGVFVTINKTVLVGRRKNDNIVAIRAGFVDLDGASLEPVLNDPVLPKPHIVTQTSPGKWHCFFLLHSIELAQFTAMQSALAVHFNSDPSVKDLPRVMRLPGFWHRKAEAFMTQIISVSADPPYDGQQFLEKLATVTEKYAIAASASAADAKRSIQEAPILDVRCGSSARKAKSNKSLNHDGDDDGNRNQWTNSSNENSQRSQGRGEDKWRRFNNNLLQILPVWFPRLYSPDGARPYQTGYRVTSKWLGRDLEEDLSALPAGIFDFGLEKGFTPIDLVMARMQVDFTKAVAWLSGTTGIVVDEDDGISEDDEDSEGGSDDDDDDAVDDKGDASRDNRWSNAEERDANEAPVANKLPVIQITPRISVLTSAAQTMLINAKVPFYQRGGELVRPIIRTVKAAHGHLTKTAQLRAITVIYMRDTICRHSIWKRYDKRANKWIRATPPLNVAETLLARDGIWAFPEIAGVIATPTMRPDGTLLTEQGYDPTTRLLLIERQKCHLSLIILRAKMHWRPSPSLRT
ncbi:DNA-primase RepB domain-containing protein [Bradyrhizobium sp. JYMT SZCCT0428]|uniref:DNA-primase RepB domain-containing protein n=1 Tax=Bradyrhizobium sp. JYMT SZCCT0428 TaxID=2807673 RepID=UPI001BA7A7F3|nr:DNA-primase RepB domain-containing protein [Bradyrhizobium sp. JYMT SZCCT0428]MBR1155639.1 hypothetical protein [Bradyrhizobium sp. JYMT SZCCT0428]